MTAPLVSIVIPCYRQAAWLPEALRSCLAQTHQALDLVVVDDGSPDDVAGAVGPFGDRVRLLRQANAGVAAARNRGLAEARGALVLFLDADDWLLPDCVAQLAMALGDARGRVAQIGFAYRDQDGAVPDDQVYPAFGRWRHGLCVGNTGAMHAFLFRTDEVRAVGGFVEEPGGHEDYDLLCRLAASGHEAVAVHGIGAIYRRVPATASRSRDADGMRRSRVAVWTRYADALLGAGIDAETAAHLLGGVARLVGARDARFGPVPQLERIARALVDARPMGATALAALANHLAAAWMATPASLAGERTDARRWREALRRCTEAAQRSVDAQRELPYELQDPLHRLVVGAAASGARAQARALLRALLARDLRSGSYRWELRGSLWACTLLPGTLAAGTCQWLRMQRRRRRGA